MIFRDIIVDMPLKKRVTKYGSHKKPYVYEILKRQGKDCEKDTVVCVGLAIDNKKMNPNEKYFEIHPCICGFYCGRSSGYYSANDAQRRTL